MNNLEKKLQTELKINTFLIFRNIKNVIKMTNTQHNYYKLKN